MVDDKPQTPFPPFCKGSDCPEIKRLEERIDKIYTRLDVIISGIITVLVTVIAGLLG
jgi:hypothetical protein